MIEVIILISLEERYENFRSTIMACGSYLLKESDDTIEYNLFEEFSVGVISFLHEDTLNMFLDEGMIDYDIFTKCKELRNIYLQLDESPNLFNVYSVKTSDEWRKILILSDEIKELLYW